MPASVHSLTSRAGFPLTCGRLLSDAVHRGDDRSTCKNGVPALCER